MPKSMGEVIVDHSASPGLPEDIALLAGYDPALCREGKIFKAAILACVHCHCSTIKNPLRTRERMKCYICDDYICDLCAFKASLPGYVHMPFEKAVEIYLHDASLCGEGSPPRLLLP